VKSVESGKSAVATYLTSPMVDRNCCTNYALVECVKEATKRAIPARSSSHCTKGIRSPILLVEGGESLAVPRR